MICRHCGKRIPDEAIFCSYCGKKLESHLRVEKDESHLRAEDTAADKPEEKKRKKKKEKYEYVEPGAKRRVKAIISIVAALIFVIAAFVAVMLFLKPYLGEEPWPDKDAQSVGSEENIGFPKSMYVTAEEGLLLHKEASAESGSIHLLNYGLEIGVEKIEDGWAYTTVDGLPGWCSAEDLTENGDEISHQVIKPKSEDDKGQLVEPSTRILSGYHGIVNSEDGLNLRCGPGEDYNILMVIPYKTEVVEEGWSNGWLYVKYDGQYGWIRSEYITPTGKVE